MPHQRTPTPRAETDETRRAILRAADQLFMALGYRAVTTRQVAEACGIKQPAIYYHFPDKEALFIEVLREHTANTAAALERIAARHTESIPERLRQVIRYLRGSRQPNMAVFLQELRHEISPKGRAQAGEFFRNGIVAPITAIFEEGRHSGFLRPATADGWQPRMATYLLLSALSHLPAVLPAHDAAVSMADPFWASTSDPAEMIVHMLLYGLAESPGEIPSAD